MSRGQARTIVVLALFAALLSVAGRYADVWAGFPPDRLASYVAQREFGYYIDSIIAIVLAIAAWVAVGRLPA